MNLPAAQPSSEAANSPAQAPSSNPFLKTGTAASSNPFLNKSSNIPGVGSGFGGAAKSPFMNAASSETSEPAKP